MTMVGIAQGYQPLISYYFGQKRMDRCKKLLRYGIVAVIVASIAFTGGCLLGADGIVGLFLEKNMTELFAYSSGVLRIFALSFLIAGYNIVIGGYFTAVEEPVSATIISMGRSIVMLILSLGLLTMIFGGAGIWWSPLLAEALTLVFTLVFFFRYLKRINA